MEPFNLQLTNGANLSGIRSIPPQSEDRSNGKPCPLLVGLHGSTYDCRYFDADAAHTASLASVAFGIPFVSINRPDYGGTSAFPPIAEGSNFSRETGSWLHSYILPSLWSTFGEPNACNCIVLLCHSLGAMGGIIAGALHGQGSNPSYPLGGVIVSGIGEKLLPGMEENPVQESNLPNNRVLFPVDMKDSLMFRPGTVHLEILQQSDRLNSPSPILEIESLRSWWLPIWREEWTSNVIAPVMFGLSEQDCFFVGTEEHARYCAAAFRRSVRVDSSIIKRAPHCLELSYWSQGWYARCFGFALECSISFSQAA
ncbi:uncharacterized protein N7459_005597 [Penicillium hispanicum]|uniref:uncharacterized protein n=1 Tax=Penicillium hispanicum TaxID=1080232 RepID=UPI00253FCCBF|nr:uncharacterized protein N7459_005597 [Penicillium hispanicum]KAJ5579612.1 hypothetical protein N7459_005597 [Penicillium hispanicum]